MHVTQRRSLIVHLAASIAAITLLFAMWDVVQTDSDVPARAVGNHPPASDSAAQTAAWVKN